MADRELPDALGKWAVGTAARWRDRGISTRRLRTLVASGELVRLRHGSYATRRWIDWARDDKRRTHALLAAAVADAVGRGAVASHQSAAFIHGIKMLADPGEAVTVTVPPDPAGKSKYRTQPGKFTCHVAALPEGHLTKKLDLPVTSPARTVADLARSDIPFWDAVVVADSALSQDLAGKGNIEVVLGECGGWPGTARARQVLAAAHPGAESPLETCGRLLVLERGLEMPEVQCTIHGTRFSYAADLYWPRYKTVLEFDGMVKYKAEADLRKQYARDQAFRDEGYRVVHASWAEVFHTPDVIIERLRKAFAAATAF